MAWTATVPVGPGECPVSFREYLLRAHLAQTEARACNKGRGKGESVEGGANVFCPPNVTAATAAPGKWNGVSQELQGPW